MKNFYAFIFLLVPSLVVAEARAQEEISKESTVQEDWFHRTDVELMRKIDSKIGKAMFAISAAPTITNY